METPTLQQADHLATTSPRRSKIWLGCGCMIAVLAMMVILPAFFLLGWNLEHGRKIEQRLEKIRTAGQPTTYAEMDQFYALSPNATDTTQLWLEGMKILDEDKLPASAKTLPYVGNGKDVLVGEPWPEIEEAEKLLQRYAEALAKFHSAAKQGGNARFPFDFSQGIATDLSHAQSLRGAARLLRLEAAVRAHRGDAAGCAESIHGVFAARRSLENAPLLVCHLICIAMHSIAIDSIADNLSRVPFSENDLQMLDADIQSFNSRASLQRAYMGERVFGCEMYNGSGADFEGKQIPFLNSDFDLYLELFEDVLAGSNNDFPKGLAAGSTFDQKLRDHMSRPVKKFTHVVTALLMPAMSSSIDATCRVTAASASARLAIAAERFRRKNGRLPQTLDELVPDYFASVPLDPYNGERLKYIRAEDHFMIYSVGRNGLDDGGDRSDQMLDTVIYVPLAKP